MIYLGVSYNSHNITSLNSIKWQVFVMDMDSVPREGGTEFLYD